MFFIALIVITLISFVWALFSLKNLNEKKEIKKASEELKKGKIIFSSDHSSSESF